MSVADSTMTRTKAFPAAGASNQCDSIDLGADRVGALGNRMTVHVKIPALASLADTKKATFQLEDSGDNASFASVVTLDQLERTGAGGAGAAAGEFRLFLPPDTRRYIRVKATVEAAGGDNTGDEYEVECRV